MDKWILELKPGAPSNIKVEVPKEAAGVGLTEAPRGALGHWISIKDQKIDNYQVVAATIWNPPRGTMREISVPLNRHLWERP